MNFAIAAAVFPVIFVGELPDKTMFASLLLASRGRAWAVWVGAAGAFLVHVVIATTVGVGLFALLPSRVVDAGVAVMFLGGAVYAFVEAGRRDSSGLVAREAASHRRTVTTAFVVIFVAEWGDLTQLLTANLAAHYHSALSVGLGSVLALWSVAGLAVLGGQGLLRSVPIAVLRRITGAVLLILGAIALWTAISG
ncbi:MAG TPA: TMEM165/GDT1 family protein [Acidimicrobiia bacterium]|jgi:putative Ca2+/H+ antiporter (TMEM165/GDT1 family)|nr:TMEM165/GDT1 family protein [Acidimicrobiia bacterium]